MAVAFKDEVGAAECRRVIEKSGEGVVVKRGEDVAVKVGWKEFEKAASHADRRERGRSVREEQALEGGKGSPPTFEERERVAISMYQGVRRFGLTRALLNRASLHNWQRVGMDLTNSLVAFTQIGKNNASV